MGNVELDRQDDRHRLWLKLPVPAGIAVAESVDAGIALFMQLCRFAHNDSFCALRVELQRPKPLCSEHFDNFFRCPIRYTAKENCLFFSEQQLQEPLVIANPALARANDQVVKDYLYRFSEKSVVSTVTQYIIEALPSGTPSQEYIAKKMALSGRTLQRKLASEGATLKALIDSARLNLAQLYLVQPRRNISEIAYLLGFSEPSNFTRAFKQWTGKTPLDYRANSLNVTVNQ